MLNAPTLRRDGSAYAPKAKPFAWSYSRLKNFEACPKKHYHIDIAKDIQEPESEQLKHGDIVHKVMAQYIEHGTVMPPVLEPQLKPWADHVFKFKGVDVRTKGAVVEVEQKYALTKDFEICEFFDKRAWFRGIGDVIWRLGPVGYIGDWKTGKILDDSQQLALMAACLFAKYPELKIVRSVFVWLKEEAETPLDIKRSDMPAMWANIWPRIEALKIAHETQNYPPKPGGLCKRWCPVKQCPHNGG